MRSNELKLRAIMVEWLCFPPSVFAMTGFAVLAKAALMMVVSLMAGEAVRRRLAHFFLGLVTAMALGPAMQAPQRKIREVMVECFGIKPDNIGVAPDMIGMARFARRGSRITIASMEALLARHILRLGLVAISAQLGLDVL